MDILTLKQMELLNPPPWPFPGRMLICSLYPFSHFFYAVKLKNLRYYLLFLLSAGKALYQFIL